MELQKEEGKGRRGFFQSRSEMGSPSRQIITNVISNLFSSVQRGASEHHKALLEGRTGWIVYRVIAYFISLKSTYLLQAGLATKSLKMICNT